MSHISTETDERVMCQDGSRSPPSSPLAKQTVFNFDSVPSQQPFESRYVLCVYVLFEILILGVLQRCHTQIWVPKLKIVTPGLWGLLGLPSNALSRGDLGRDIILFVPFPGLSRILK